MKWTLLLLAFAAPGFCESGKQAPPQALRGEQLFNATAKPVPCSTCHSLGGHGNAIAPDLTRWGRVSPRGTAYAITSTVTEKVVFVRSKSGDFPAIRPEGQSTGTRFYDLSGTKPVLRVLNLGDVIAVQANSKWQHPFGKQPPTPEELADLIAFIRWAAVKDVTEIRPADVR